MSIPKKTIILSILVTFTLLGGSVFLVLATSPEDIIFPVKELGNCRTETACRAYCDDSKNIKICLEFAEKHNLMSPEELRAAKKFAEMGTGPGGCKGKDNCESYCNDVSRIDECLSFAESSGILPTDELQEAKKVQAALKRGVKLPGGCHNKNECESYCSNSEHMEECIAFAEASGFIPLDELADAKKALGAIKKGFKPPSCSGKDQCGEYCSQPNNMEACMEFALAANFIPEEQQEEMQKVLRAIKSGAKPPSCRSKSQCNEYCSQPENLEECIAFAQAAGFVSPEEAERVRKTGGRGPGDCQGKEECESFCQDPANQEVCFNFAKEHDLISQEELQKIEEGKRQIMESFSNAPPQVMDCFMNAFGGEQVEKLKAGTAIPFPDMGDKIKHCFEENIPMPQDNGMPPSGIMPKGMSPDEIIPEEMPSDENINYPANSEFIGPGDCRTMEECQSFCQANPQECGISIPPNATAPLNQELPSVPLPTIEQPSQELPPLTIEQLGSSILEAVNYFLKFFHLSP